MKIPPGMVREFHAHDGGAYACCIGIRTIAEFVKDWSDISEGIEFAESIDDSRAYLGIVHEAGAYLIEVKPGTNAARLADQWDAESTVTEANPKAERVTKLRHFETYLDNGGELPPSGGVPW